MKFVNFEIKREAANNAKEQYENLREFLEEAVFPYRESVERAKGNEKYDARFGINSFSIVLQYSLLQIAVADRKISTEELMLIEDICRRTSIEKQFQKIEPNFTWNSLHDWSIFKVKKLLKKFEPNLLKISKDFIESFALYDAHTENKDYLKVFEHSCLAFIYAVMTASGPILKIEEKTPCFLFAAVDAIKNNKVEHLKGSDMTGPDDLSLEAAVATIKNAKSHRTLKDCYKTDNHDILISEKEVDFTEKEKALVYIEVENEKSAGSGSGFMITESGLCFTCYHVVKGAKSIFVRLDDGSGNRTVKPAVIVKFDEPNDFAILQVLEVEKTCFFKLERNFNDIKVGDDISIYGFPYGTDLNKDVIDLEPSLTKGYISSRNKIENKFVYYLDARSCPGFSGGPVFLLKTNKVIGYLCGAYGDESFVYCRSLEEFFKMIEEKRK